MRSIQLKRAEIQFLSLTETHCEPAKCTNPLTVFSEITAITEITVITEITAFSEITAAHSDNHMKNIYIYIPFRSDAHLF